MFQLDNGPVSKLGWTSEQQLVCVAVDGTVVLFSIFGDSSSFNLSAVSIATVACTFVVFTFST